MTSGHRLRQLFPMIHVFGMPDNPGALWNQFAEELSADLPHRKRQQLGTDNLSELDVRPCINMALVDLDRILQEHNERLSKYRSMPAIDAILIEDVVDEEVEYDVTQLQARLERSISLLNPDQTDAFNRIVNAINGQGNEHLFFLDGAGGTGKTFVYNTLLAYVRSRSETALAVASTGIAALLLDGGRTAHSQFNIPTSNLSATSTCDISARSSSARVTRSA